MDNNKITTAEENQQQEVKRLFNFRAIYTSLILNWTWFVVSILVCLAGAYIYLRYSTPYIRLTQNFSLKTNRVHAEATASRIPITLE